MIPEDQRARMRLKMLERVHRDSGNPLYAWMAILTARNGSLELPGWVRSYLEGVAGRLLEVAHGYVGNTDHETLERRSRGDLRSNERREGNTIIVEAEPVPREKRPGRVYDALDLREHGSGQGKPGRTRDAFDRFTEPFPDFELAYDFWIERAQQSWDEARRRVMKKHGIERGGRSRVDRAWRDYRHLLEPLAVGGLKNDPDC